MVQAATAAQGAMVVQVATPAQGAMEVIPVQGALTTTEPAKQPLLAGIPADVYDEKHEWEN